jgi:ABC-2 type transport system permease protein
VHRRRLRDRIRRVDDRLPGEGGGVNPERASRGGSAGRFQALLFVLYPLALAPVLLAYLARYAFDSDAAFLAMLALAAAGGAGLYAGALRSAARSASERREQIVAELSKGEGPVATD